MIANMWVGKHRLLHDRIYSQHVGGQTAISSRQNFSQHVGGQTPIIARQNFSSTWVGKQQFPHDRISASTWVGKHRLLHDRFYSQHVRGQTPISLRQNFSQHVGGQTHNLSRHSACTLEQFGDEPGASPAAVARLFHIKSSKQQGKQFYSKIMSAFCMRGHMRHMQMADMNLLTRREHFVLI